MFDNLFAKFKKKEIKEVLAAVKTEEELTQEFAGLKVKYAQIANSELYGFLKEYYQVRLDINRDILEGLNPHNEENKARILQAQCENKVIRDFITDIEDMKNQYNLTNESVV